MQGFILSKKGNIMTIGLPKALLYYRYKDLWNTFFSELGCAVITSPDTTQTMLAEGIAHSIGECCLPVKLFMGHVASLFDRCDHILVPRFETLKKNEEFCTRFWGLPDIVRNTYPDASLLSYDLQGQKPDSEWHGFLQMGKFLGKSYAQTRKAYRSAKQEQQRTDHLKEESQRKLLSAKAPKILVVSQSYIIHDAYIGKPLTRMLREQGGTLIFADECDRQVCRAKAKSLSRDLYWALNEEIIGAIPLMKNTVDGILLITSFPCGSDSLVNELVLRRVRDFPMIQIILDEQQGEAGLQTRIESFMDMIHERKDAVNVQ